MFHPKDLGDLDPINLSKFSSVPTSFWNDLTSGKGVSFNVTLQPAPVCREKGDNRFDLICPSCGYNLGNKPIASKKSTKSTSECNAKARQKPSIQGPRSLTEEHAKRNSVLHPQSRQNSKTKPDSKNLKGFHKTERNAIGNETTVPVCDYNQDMFTSPPRHRTLSDLLRLEKSGVENFQGSKNETRNGSRFSNDWLKYGRNEENPAQRRSTGREQKGWWSPKEIENDGNQDHRNSVAQKRRSRNDSNSGRKKTELDPDNNDPNMSAIIEQNSRTILRDRKIVQKMRNCWERFLMLKLQNPPSNSNKNPTLHSDDGAGGKKQEIERKNRDSYNVHQSRHASQDKMHAPQVLQCVCEPCGACKSIRKNTGDINSHHDSKKNSKISGAEQLPQEKIEKPSIFINEKENTVSEPYHSPESNRKRTFGEIRNEFEISSLQELERLRGDTLMSTRQQQNQQKNSSLKPMIIVNKKSETMLAEEERKKERKLSSISSQDKVKLWMEKNTSYSGSSGFSNFVSAKNDSSHSKFSSQSDTNVCKNTHNSTWNKPAASDNTKCEENGAGCTPENPSTGMNFIQLAGQFELLPGNIKKNRRMTDEFAIKNPPVPTLADNLSD